MLYNKRSQFFNVSVRYVHSIGGSKSTKEMLVGVKEEIASLRGFQFPAFNNREINRTEDY